MLPPWKKSNDQSRWHIKKQRHYFANKGLSSQGYGLSSNHAWPWVLDYRESWAPKNWCFWTAVLEKNLKSPLDCREVQPVYLKGNQSWMFIGRIDAEAETPVLWPPDTKNWPIGKDPDAVKVLRQKEKLMSEDEMVEWHDRLRWTWIWASSMSWWWTGKPGVLHSMGLQRVGHDWATELMLLFHRMFAVWKSQAVHEL